MLLKVKVTSQVCTIVCTISYFLLEPIKYYEVLAYIKPRTEKYYYYYYDYLFIISIIEKLHL